MPLRSKAAKVLEPRENPEVVVDDGDATAAATQSDEDEKREDTAESPGARNNTESPGARNGYALTDVIDDLMAAEFPETTAPQADAEEVVLLSPTPPTFPPPPPPSSEPEEADKPEETEVKSVEDGERAAGGHGGSHESRVTLSGPLQFMGRNDLPRCDDGDGVTASPPQSPVSSPVKLLDVLPAPLRDAAAVEATLPRTIPLTSGSIDAVSLDDTQSPWSGAETTRETTHDQRDVFDDTPTTGDVNVDNADHSDTVEQREKADADSPGALEPISATVEAQTSETSAVILAVESSDAGVSLCPS